MNWENPSAGTGLGNLCQSQKSVEDGEQKGRSYAEKELCKSEERYRRLMDLSPELVAIHNGETYLYINPAGVKMLGARSAGELIGRPINGIIHPDSWEEAQDRIHRLKTGETFLPLRELKFVRLDGRIIDVEVAASPIPLNGDTAIQVVGRDVTDRKRDLEALRRSEETARKLAQENAVMAEISRIIGSTLNVEEVYELFAVEARKILEFDKISINIVDYATQTVSLSYVTGQPVQGRDAKDVFPLEGSLTAEGIRSKGGVIYHPQDENEVAARFPVFLPVFRKGLHSAMSVPLISGNRVIGALNFISVGSNVYRQEDLRLAQKVGSQIAGAIANAQLYAERLRAEESLKESEEKFRCLAEDATVGIAIFQDGKYRYVNPKYCEIFGYSREELVDRKGPLDVIHPEDRAMAEESLRKRFLHNVPSVHYEARGLTKDGKTIDIEIYGSRVNYRGRIASIGTVNDITERKKGEEERILLSAAVEQSGEMVLIADRQGKIRYVNPAFVAISGFGREEVIGQDPGILEDGNREAHRDFWGFIAQGQMWRGCLRLWKKDGSAFEAEMTASPIRDASGAIRNYVAAIRDVTRENQLAAQFQHAQKMEAIGQLAGGIAHDFNNSLTLIRVTSQLALLDIPEKDPLREKFEQIEGATQHSASLARQLLAFSSQQIMEMQALDLNQVILNLKKMLLRTIGEDIDLVDCLAENLGSVMADPSQIEQTILNLALNARDAMPNGGKLIIETKNVTLNEEYTRNQVSVPPGRYALISVRDTGAGMAPEIQGRIFEPFFTTKEKGKGTGLGLASVYGIVKQSKGTIEVESEPGVGTVFKIFLPVTEEPFFKEAEKAVKDEIPRGEETVLVVEDELHVREIVKQILNRQGYKVLTAGNGGEALMICEKFEGTIHLLITDLVMPGMTGRELAECLLQSRAGMKVLYMSGYSKDNPVQPDDEGTAIPFIQKPFSIEKLSAKVRETLRGASCASS